MISQPLPNFKTQFSQKEDVGSYDNIALNQHISLLMSMYCRRPEVVGTDS